MLKIVGSGSQCPVCGRPVKQFIRETKRATEYAFFASSFLHPRPQRPLDERIRAVYLIYNKTKRRKNDLDQYRAVDEILVKEKILADEKVITSRDGSRILTDKNRPRTEIYLYKEEEQNG